MATLQIPVRVDPVAYTMGVELESLFYNLTFRFNARDGHWFMDVAFDDVTVITGVKVVHGVGLLDQFPEFVVDNRLPPGTIEVLDVAGADRDPDRDTFGDEVVMLYEESA